MPPALTSILLASILISLNLCYADAMGSKSQLKMLIRRALKNVPIERTVAVLSADAQVSTHNSGLESAAPKLIRRASRKRDAVLAVSYDARVEQMPNATDTEGTGHGHGIALAALNKLKEDMNSLWGEGASGFFSDRATAGLASLLQGPSAAEMQTLQSRILAKSPQTCNASLVSQACDQHNTSAADLAQILRVPLNMVTTFFSEAGITDASPSCQDLCEKALQLIPAEGRPPGHYVGGIRHTPDGPIEWVLDMSPEALSNFGGDSGAADNDDNENEAEGTPADLSVSPPPGGEDKTALGVATQICEMFDMFPYVGPTDFQSLLREGAHPWFKAKHFNGGNGEALKLNGHKVSDIADCRGLNQAKRDGCTITENGAICKEGGLIRRLPPCVCWDRAGPYPALPSEVQRLWFYSAASAILAKSKWPELLRKKQQMIKHHFGFDYDDGCNVQSDACKKSKVLENVVERIYEQFFENTRFCYDAASPAHVLGWGGGGPGSFGGGPPTWAVSANGWLDQDFKNRVRTMVHEHCHMYPLGLLHGTEIEGPRRLPDGTEIEGTVANCYVYANYFRDLMYHWVNR